MRRLIITQSNYIPWKGYFDMIAICDEFIVLDDVQYTRRDWRNRNQIKTQKGVEWLTVPVDSGEYGAQRICEVKISDHGFVKKHRDKIFESYRGAQHFKEFFPWLEALYHEASQLQMLSEVNILFIKKILNFLEIETKISQSYDHFSLEELQNFSASERLLKLAQKAGATHYISGAAAKDYMDVGLFERAQIEVEWSNYENYAPYQQLHGEFTHFVSIIDMIFNLGKDTIKYMKKEGVIDGK